MKIILTITYDEGATDMRPVWEYLAQAAVLQYPEIRGVEIETEEGD